MTRVHFFCALLCFSGSLAWPSLGKSSENDGVVFCYYGEWANTRPGAGRFGVSDIPTDLCTHIVYSFLTLDGPTGNLIIPLESTHEEKSNSVADLIALKRSNANLKILAAIGGWVEGSDNFSPMKVPTTHFTLKLLALSFCSSAKMVEVALLTALKKAFTDKPKTCFSSELLEVTG
ncbi:endochitinase-like [Cydia fagiglandana]|uniref:endochitinase-like n=1 Tax=Cydia fagiglandana TaxID=1458189 RepID=UPI002FEE2D7A